MKIPEVIPEGLRGGLTRLCEALQAADGANIACLAVYGGVARGRYRVGASDVNLVLLLKDASTAKLELLAPAVRQGFREMRAAFLVLGADEWPRMVESFPVKALDVQAHHEILLGEERLDAVSVSPAQVRLRIEQELLNQVLHLRRRFLFGTADPGALRSALAEAARPAAIALAALLRVSGKAEPEDDRSAAIFAAAGRELQLDNEALAALAQLRHNEPTQVPIATLFGRVLDTLQRAAALASAESVQP